MRYRLIGFAGFIICDKDWLEVISLDNKEAIRIGSVCFMYVCLSDFFFGAFFVGIYHSCLLQILMSLLTRRSIVVDNCLLSTPMFDSVKYLQITYYKALYWKANGHLAFYCCSTPLFNLCRNFNSASCLSLSSCHTCQDGFIYSRDSSSIYSRISNSADYETQINIFIYF